MSNDIAIRQVNSNVWDVFQECGWNNWTRVRRVYDRQHRRVHFQPIAGQLNLPRSVWEMINSEVN